MLVKDLIALLQKVPATYMVMLSMPIDDEHPMYVDLYPEDFEVDDDLEMLQLDGTISEEVDDEVCELLDAKKLKPNDILIVSRQDSAPRKKTVSERIKTLGLTVYINELKTGF
jgi:hypothetical protein